MIPIIVDIPAINVIKKLNNVLFIVISMILNGFLELDMLKLVEEMKWLYEL